MEQLQYPLSAVCHSEQIISKNTQIHWTLATYSFCLLMRIYKDAKQDLQDTAALPLIMGIFLFKAEGAHQQHANIPFWTTSPED